MLRQELLDRGGERDFRWRGSNVSRIEGLSDGVFALALTLIVVTLQVPQTYGELVEVFVQAPVFLVCFATLAMFWWFQFQFHRRYGLEDRVTHLLDLALLFLILLYVYPLRFLFSFLYNALLLGRDVRVADSTGGMHPVLSSQFEAQQLMLIYGAGLIAIYSTLAGQYARAWKRRIELELDSVERVITKSTLHGHMLSAGIGVVSVAIAACDARWTGWAGITYGAMGPVHGVHGWLTRRAIERYRGKVPDAPKTP